MHLRTSQTPFIALPSYYRDVIEQQANITKATVATKGIILHMLWQRFRKGLT